MIVADLRVLECVGFIITKTFIINKKYTQILQFILQVLFKKITRINPFTKLYFLKYPTINQNVQKLLCRCKLFVVIVNLDFAKEENGANAFII